MVGAIKIAAASSHFLPSTVVCSGCFLCGPESGVSALRVYLHLWAEQTGHSIPTVQRGQDGTSKENMAVAGDRGRATDREEQDGTVPGSGADLPCSWPASVLLGAATTHSTSSSSGSSLGIF